jgi:hypothetical protein
MSAPPKKGGGLSLYADLLQPNKQNASGSTISSAPVRYDIQKSGSAGDEDAQRKKDGTVSRPMLPPLAKAVKLT